MTGRYPLRERNIASYNPSKPKGKIPPTKLRGASDLTEADTPVHRGTNERFNPVRFSETSQANSITDYPSTIADSTMHWDHGGEDLDEHTMMPDGEVLGQGLGLQGDNLTMTQSPEAHKRVVEGNMSIHQAAENMLSQCVHDEVTTPPISPSSRTARGELSPKVSEETSQNAEPKPELPAAPVISTPVQRDSSESWSSWFKGRLWVFFYNLFLVCVSISVLGGMPAWTFLYVNLWVWKYIIYGTSIMILGWFSLSIFGILFNGIFPRFKDKPRDSPPKLKVPFKEASVRIPSRRLFEDKPCSFQNNHVEEARETNVPLGVLHNPRGKFPTSTPGLCKSNLPRPQKFDHPSRSKGKISFGDRSTYPSNNPGGLTIHDLDVINDSSYAGQVSFSHSPKIPEYSGKTEDYFVFPRDFLAILPTIPTRLRLSTLRSSLCSLESKKVIEDFEDTDSDTFIEALKALDEEYNNPDYTLRHLLLKIRNLTQTIPKSDEDFVSIMTELSSLLKRLVRVQEGVEVHLEPLAFPWMSFVPEPVYRKAQRLVGRNRSWLTFENLYKLAEEHAQAVKRTKDLSANRLKVQRAAIKGNQHFTYHAEAEDFQEGSISEEEDPFNLHYVKGRSKPVDCCFCRDQGNGHHSTVCPVERSPSERRDIARSLGLCYLCLEKHLVRECPFLKLKITLDFRCQDCSVKLPHCTLLCDTPRAVPKK